MKTLLKTAILLCIGLNIYMILVRYNYIELYGKESAIKTLDSTGIEQNRQPFNNLNSEYKYE